MPLSNDTDSPSQPFDLAVVGGGVLGTFHAFHALRRGLRVGLFERSSQPRGATVRNFGQVVPSGLGRDWRPVGRRSVALYRELQAEADLTIRDEGTLYVASDDEELGLLEERHAIAAAEGDAAQLLTADECRRRVPSLRADYARGGLLFEDELSVDPRRMIGRLHEHMRTLGDYEPRFGTAVHAIEPADAGGATLGTAAGDFAARRVVVCGGVEFGALFPRLFAESDLVAVKLQMLRTAPLPAAAIAGNLLTGLSIRRYESFAECPSWAAVKDREPGDSPERRWGVHLLFTQTPDGRVIVGDSHEYRPVAAADELDHELSGEVNDLLLDRAAGILDLPAWPIESTWAGFYCQTPDPRGVFVRDVAPGVRVATGIGGKGMTSSAGFAEQNLREMIP